ncbi:MAG: hypothetical protein K2X81_05340 [Candidatus Obscuribacterales bacterium]|nr:hypothetical protein [Candidatus Obscuribacterales bacterium]
MSAAKNEGGTLNDLPVIDTVKRILMPVGIFWILPWIILGVTCICSPSYIIPFLNHPTGRLVMLLVFAWETLGCLLLARYRHAIVWVAVMMFCILPAILVPMLGPAVIVILQALGPVT